MRTKNIRTLTELQAEIRRLKLDYEYKGIQLKLDSKAYIGQFTPGNLIKKYLTPSSLLKIDEKTNISGKILSLVLPMIMNNTVFRGSGVITKALGALISGKVGQSLNAESLAGIFNSVKSLFAGKKGKNKANVAFVDYGIPPDSETY
ncbi:MAG: hypothetical protein EOO90_01860 [Pedobacter sp.]|nr:MAG: hypothetical protein EOO90_01860 [Pedobacter sp.]